MIKTHRSDSSKSLHWRASPSLGGEPRPSLGGWRSLARQDRPGEAPESAQLWHLDLDRRRSLNSESAQLWRPLSFSGRALKPPPPMRRRINIQRWILNIAKTLNNVWPFFIPLFVWLKDDLVVFGQFSQFWGCGGNWEAQLLRLDKLQL